MENQNSNKKCKHWKDMVRFVKAFEHYHQKFNFGYFLSSPLKDLNLKFRPKFVHGYLHCAIPKALYNFKVKSANEARDNLFLFQNIQNECTNVLMY